MVKERVEAYSFTEGFAEVGLNMVKETKTDSVVIKNHFKSSTQDELDFKLANILSDILSKELSTVKQDKNTI